MYTYMCKCTFISVTIKNVKHLHSLTGNQATIFLILGLQISWPEKQVGRSGKKKKKKSK